MPSSYSSNLKIELQATGENSGTWGTITNTNLGTALEQAIVGYGNPSYASDANLTLTYTDTNAAQAARALVLNVTSAVSLTGTRELVVPTIQKQYIVQNNTTGSQSITVKTSGGTGITVPNGRKAHLYVDGTNVIYMDDFVDINGGAIDGTTIGANSAAAGTFTTVGATTGNITTVNATTVDTTNIEVTNLKAKDGTAAGSIADSTGVVTLASSVLTTTDINGGTIDGTTIGGSSAAAGTFTTLTTSSTVTLNGGTANGVLYLNGSKAATSGSALVFDGTNFTAPRTQITTAGSPPASGAGLEIIGGTSPLLFAYNRGTSAYLPLNSTASAFGWSLSGSDAMTLTSTGLGIGTSSPSYKLDVSGAINSSADIISQGNDARFSLYRSAGINYFDWSSGQSLYFSTQTSAGGAGRSTRMVIDSSGNVGIGTSSPGDKLHVAGTIRFGANASFYGTIAHDSASTGANIYNHTDSGGHLFQVGGNTLMNLNVSGNLGLGVTPSAWTSPDFRALQVGSGISLFGRSTGDADRGGLTANCYNDGAWKYIATGNATRYEQSDGAHSWLTAASGTAGNTITFTQAMTLDASGNLSVKTTTSRANITTDADLVTQNGFGVLATSTTYGQGYQFARFMNSAAAYAGSISHTASTGIGLYSADALILGASSTERARITSGGYFKASNAGTYVNSTGDYHELRTNVSNQLALVISNSASSNPYGASFEFTGAAPNDATRYFWKCEDTTNLRAALRSNGGLANYQTNNADLSDARTKKDIAPAESMWGKIGALEIVTYKYNDQTHDDVNLGVIAQQVESVEPVWVDNDGFGETPEGEEPLKTVYTKDIYFAAIKALQEAMARIEQLEAKVAVLESK
jgi:hypothetical protein